MSVWAPSEAAAATVSAKQPIAIPMAVRAITTRPAAATTNQGYARRAIYWVADATACILRISSAMTARVDAAV